MLQSYKLRIPRNINIDDLNSTLRLQSSPSSRSDIVRYCTSVSQGIRLSSFLPFDECSLICSSASSSWVSSEPRGSDSTPLLHCAVLDVPVTEEDEPCCSFFSITYLHTGAGIDRANREPYHSSTP